MVDMGKFEVIVNSCGRWYEEIVADTPEKAYNKVASRIKINEPRITINRIFCEQCDFSLGEKIESIHPKYKEFTEINKQNYGVSVIVEMSFKIEIEAEDIEKARDKAWDIWMNLQLPAELEIIEEDVDEDDEDED